MYKAKKEVDDLSEILPDIKAKIEDCEDERKNMDQLKNLAKEALVCKIACDILTQKRNATRCKEK